MLKILLLSLLSLFSFAALAISPKEANEKALASAVTYAQDSLSKVKLVGKVKLPCLVKLSPQFSAKGINDDCDQFFDNAGNIGLWGNQIIQTISKIPHEELANSFYSNDIPDMNFICPKFKKFSMGLKLKFWVWTFASISWQESSCNHKVSAKGINARAIGLLQLEDSRQLRKSRGPNCDVPSVKDPNNNLACGVDILHQQLLGAKGDYFKNFGTGELFWKNGYWQHLRLKDNSSHQQKILTARSQGEEISKKTDIKELVMRFPYCQ